MFENSTTASPPNSIAEIPAIALSYALTPDQTVFGRHSSVTNMTRWILVLHAATGRAGMHG